MKVRTLVGVNYRPRKGADEARVEAGEVVDLPAAVARDLLERGKAEEVGKAAAAADVDETFVVELEAEEV